jgi:hypothetical protein
MGAELQGWVYDRATSSMIVHVRNTSTKAITAFVLGLAITDADGRSTSPSDSTLTRDFVANAAVLARAKGTINEDHVRRAFGSESIPPGGSYDEHVPLGPGFKDFNAVLQLVVFDDNTAIGAKRDFDTLSESRNATVASIDKAVRAIQASSSHDEAEQRVRTTLAVWKAAPHQKEDLNSAELDSIANDLKNLSLRSGSEADKLNGFLADKQKERAVWAANAKLTLGGAQ